MRTNGRIGAAILVAVTLASGQPARGALLTDPDDPRTWQGATVETFRQLLGFADRQALIDAHVLDDGIFPTCIDRDTFPAPPALPACGADTTCLGTGQYIGTVQGSAGFSLDPLSHNYNAGGDYGLAG